MRLLLGHKIQLLLQATILISTMGLLLVSTVVFEQANKQVDTRGHKVLVEQAEGFLSKLVAEQARALDGQLKQARVKAILASQLIEDHLRVGAHGANPVIGPLLRGLALPAEAGEEWPMCVYAVSGTYWCAPVLEGTRSPEQWQQYFQARIPLMKDLSAVPEIGLWAPVDSNPFSALTDLSVDALAPIVHDGRLWGYASTIVSIGALTARYNQLQPFRGSYSFLVDDRKRLVGAPPQARVELADADTFRVRGVIALDHRSAPEIDDVFHQMALGGTGRSALSLKGQNKYLAYHPLQSINWCIGIAVSESMVTAATNELVAVVDDASERVTTGLLTWGITVVALILIVGLIVAHRLAQPLQDISRATAHIVAGDYSGRVSATSGDEIGELARRFNHMAAHLQTLIAEKEQQNVELRQTSEVWQQQTELLELVISSMGDGLIVANTQGRFLLWNHGAVRIAGMNNMEAGIAAWSEHYHFFGADGVTPLAMAELPLMRAIRGEAAEGFESFMRSDDRKHEGWISCTARPLYDTSGQLRGGVLVFRDITNQKELHRQLEYQVEQRTQALRDAQKRLVEAAHQAGMAEVASNVLHNAGNVLNSVNVAAMLLGEYTRESRIGHLRQLVDLIDSHEGDLAHFFSEDEKGRLVPAYLRRLVPRLEEEHGRILSRVSDLAKGVEHLRNIITVQQDYATSSKLLERVSLHEVISDALRISEAAMVREKVAVIQELSELEEIRLDRHKLLQVLVNLLSNAKYALRSTPPEDRRLVVRLKQEADDEVAIEVEDNGAGIALEIQQDIFRHGFTTRADGHGFGLHSCAVAAQALGGTLTVHSDGPGEGACFRLTVPIRAADLQ